VETGGGKGTGKEVKGTIGHCPSCKIPAGAHVYGEKPRNHQFTE